MTSILFVLPNLTQAGMESQLVMLLQELDPKEFHLELALFRDFTCPLREMLPKYVKVIDLKKQGKLDFFFYKRLFNLIRTTPCQIIVGKISGVNEILMLMCGFLRQDRLLLEIQSTRAVLGFYYWMMKILFRIFPHRNWWVLCNSRKAATELKTYLPPGKRITYIGNGVDLQDFSRTTELAKSYFCIGFVGRLVSLKNLETLFKAAHLLISNNLNSDIRLLIAGRQTDIAYVARLTTLLQRMGIQDRVTFVNHTDHVQWAYNQMDVFVLPSWVEGTPNVLLEAMACERICIVSRGANTDQFVNDEYQFETFDPADLTMKLTRVKEMSISERLRIGAANREFVAQHYTKAGLAAKYRALWHQMTVS
jgi:glycosyltransferase involved in cell wall biosynthesis